ncbi:MAG: energy transducer TonB [Gammaproteobacteria bacterium]|nr:MAG: energy transducer TonB [Gammaproteobacteria bacterium]
MATVARKEGEGASSHSRSEPRTAAQAARPVPEGARPLFFAHIRYPWQARRMGWQGRVEVGFDVLARRLNHVRLLASSGHHVLDDAALDGVKAVDRVDLADGSYVLPVRFVLQ